MKIKTNDKVRVIKGKDKGKEGKVLQVFPSNRLVVVEGVNTRYKHMRSQGRQGQAGQRVEFSAPMKVENVMLIDPKTNEPTRVGYQILENGKKVRISKKSKEVID